eukprot:m51a1_g11783 hypothetical protein (349) ;mRNA; f:294618-295737
MASKKRELEEPSCDEPSPKRAKTDAAEPAPDTEPAPAAEPVKGDPEEKEEQEEEQEQEEQVEQVEQRTLQDLLGFNEEKSLAKDTDFAEHFARIALELMSGWTVYIAGVPHRLTEVEFYLNGGAHPDIFTHGDEMQKTHAHWYFHRTGGKYRGGTFKGMDITFAREELFGGILVRGLQKLDPPTVFLDGPCVCVDHILKLTKMGSIAELVEAEGTTEAWKTREGRLLYLERSEAPRSVAPVATPRVGLTLKDWKEAKDRYVMRQYRFVTNPRDTKKGKHHIVLAMRRAGKDAASVAAATGTSSANVAKYWELAASGRKRKSTSSWREKQLSSDDVCELYGWADANDCL